MHSYLSTVESMETPLDRLRYQRYYEELATKGSQLQPQNLPPTSAAARYHSLRVYLRVKQRHARLRERHVN